jgi:hypothetical protein
MLDTQNQGPQCTACGSPMRLTAIAEHVGPSPQCKRVQRHIIESAAAEAWLAPKK